MKKVLLVTGSLNAGGLEKVALDIVNYSDKNKLKFSFLIWDEESSYYEKEAVALGCEIIRINKPSSNFVQYYMELKQTIRDYGPYDIVHSHIYYNSGIVLKAAKKVGVPCCISHSHSIKRKNDNKLKNRIVHLLLRYLLNKYSDYCCSCSYQAGINLYGTKNFKKKGIVILNPVDLDDFLFSNSKRNHIRKELNITENQLVIGQVSRLVAGKNQRFLIDILNKLSDHSDIILVLVGDGPERNELEHYAKKMNVYDKIRFTGTRNDIPALLSAMDVFIMTSFHEGLGIVIIEALANGLQCICEEHAIVTEIKNTQLCSYINGFNIDEWCNKITELNTFHRNDTKQMLMEFSSSIFKNKLEKIYLNK